MSEPLRVLILEDQPADAELMARELTRAGFAPDWRRVDTETGYRTALDPALDVVLADYHLPEFDAPRALQLLQARGLDIPFIVVSGTVSDEAAVECMRQGAADYLLKDRLARLAPAVSQAVAARRLRDGQRRLGEVLRALVEVGRDLAERLDFAQVAERVVEAVLRVFGVRRATLYAVDAAAGELVCVATAGHGERERWLGRRLAIGAGLAGRAAAERRPLWTADVDSEPGLAVPSWARELSREEGLGSGVAVPLVARSTTTGALSLGAEAGRAFTEVEVRLVAAFADQAAVALQNASLFDEKETRLRQTETLLAVGRSVSTTLDPVEGMRRVARELARALGCDFVGAYVPDREGEVLRPLAGYRIPKDLLEVFRAFEIPLKGHRFLVEAWESQAPVFSTDAEADDRIDRFTAERFPVRSLLFVPMLSQGELVGGLFGIWLHAVHTCTPEELRLADGIGRQAALAIANATLYADAERRRRAAESLTELGQVVSRSLDPDVVAQRIADSLLALVGARIAALYRLEPSSGDLVAIAGAGDLGDGFRPGLILPKGIGLTGLAVRTGTPMVTDDLLADPRVVLTPDLRARVERGGSRALVAVPLSAQGRVIGALAVGDRVGRVFSAEELGLIQALGDQAALALENARLYRAAVRRGEELGALLRASQSVMGGLDLDVTLPRIIREAAEIAGTPHVKILLLDREARLLRPGAVSAGGVSEDFAVPLGASYSGTVATTGRPLFVADTQGDPGNPLAERDRAAGIRTYLGLPVRFGGEVLGVLTFYTTAPHRYTPEDLAYLGSFADQAAVAIRTGQLLRQARTRQARLQALLEIGRELGRIQPLEPLLGRIAEACARLLDADAARFRLAEGDRLVVAGAWGDDLDALPVGPIGLEAGVNGVVARTGRPLAVPDVALEPRFSEAYREAMDRLGYRGWLGVPVRLGDQVLGVLNLLTRRAQGFTAEDVEVAMAFADQAALALENARLYAAAERRRREAEVVAELARTINVSLDLDAVLRQVADAAHELTDSDLAGIALREGESRSVRLRYGIGARTVETGQQVIEPGKGAGGIALATGRPFRTADCAHDPRISPDYLDGVRAEGIVASLAVPIRIEGQVEGLLSAANRSPRAFTEADEAILVRLADHAGIAIRNARLYAEARGAYDELSRTQAQLLQAQKMEAVGRLAGGIAHDFNNLLTIIGGRAQILLQRLGPDDPLRRHLKLIHDTSERAATLTRQLLAFSRKQVLQPRILDLDTIVTGMEKMLRRLIGEDVELSTVPASSPGRVQADPGQLEQVILNLAVNARDAMPRGGRLTLETGTAELSPDAARLIAGGRPGRYVTLTVSDTGVGMDAETRARIFEPFFTTKPFGRGTGLGLATVYGIVAQSEGFIRVDSAPGLGATFTIYLPRAEAGEAAAAETGPPRAPAPTGSETILVVEDEAELRELVCEGLEASGYRVLAAAGPEEALRLGAGHPGPIHLLLTDVVMPKMSGRVLADRLASGRPAMRVLYVSGYTDDAISHHGVLDPGTALLPKPFTLERLAHVVREVLDVAARPGVAP